MKTPRCPDCDVAMKEGWLPDASYLQVLQAGWMEGRPDRSKQAGFDFGFVRAKGLGTALQAWRCPSCFLVRCYAPPRKWRKVD